MYAFKITLKNKNIQKKHDQQYEDWVHRMYDYVYFLERAGQIVKTKHHHIIVNKNTLQVTVLCPETDSLSLKYCSDYNLKLIEKIQQNAGAKLSAQFIGRDADNPNYKVPQNSSYFILRTGWESPLLCGDTHRPIPLYKIPCTDHKGVDYDNIFFWNQDYERLYGLWQGSSEYESYAQAQLQDPNSAINKRGREIAATIEKLTGIACYYFLFNYRSINQKADKQRKCPITGNDWYIKDKSSSDFIAFKCYESRLVSELTANSSITY